MNDGIHECDSYRAFEMVTEPDPRGVGVLQTTSLENWQKYVDQGLKLSSHIPRDILIQLETVKNLFLYSWFVYRFGMVAKTQILNATELALSAKFGLEGEPEPQGLNNKLKRALALGWFDDGAFPHLRGRNGDQEKSLFIIGALTSLRNSLNHGSTMLFDPLGLVEVCQNALAIINALFENKDVQANPR